MNKRISSAIALCFLAAAISTPAMLLPAPSYAQSAVPAQGTNIQAAPDLQGIIREAAARYQLPEAWITEVIRAESNGNARAVSPKGAQGLMQIMPGTWDYLRRKLRLGSNPFAVRDNVMAGSAYLRELYDRFGFPGCLAAYNAGPGRYASWVKGKRGLPRETVNYVSKITARLGRSAAPLDAGRRQPSKQVAARHTDSGLFVRASSASDARAEGRGLSAPEGSSETAAQPEHSLFVPRGRAGINP